MLADQSSPPWTGRFAPFSSYTQPRSKCGRQSFYRVLIGHSVNCLCALLCLLLFVFLTLSTVSASQICSSSSDNNTAKGKVVQEVLRWPERFWFICNLVLLLSSSLCGGVVGRGKKKLSRCVVPPCQREQHVWLYFLLCIRRVQVRWRCWFIYLFIFADFVVWWLIPPQRIQPQSVLSLAFICILCLNLSSKKTKGKKKITHSSLNCDSWWCRNYPGEMTLTHSKSPLIPATRGCGCFHRATLFMLPPPQWPGRDHVRHHACAYLSCWNATEAVPTPTPARMCKNMNTGCFMN